MIGERPDPEEIQEKRILTERTKIGRKDDSNVPEPSMTDDRLASTSRRVIGIEISIDSALRMSGWVYRIALDPNGEKRQDRFR
jgi:hypothetical protein